MLAFTSSFVPGTGYVSSISSKVKCTRLSMSAEQGHKSTVGISVIGCGRIGRVHANTLSSLQTANLISVADPFEEFGRNVANDFGTEWTPEWKDLLKDDKVKGIVIASPTPFHADQIIACAENGKDIFCEKPISNDIETIDKCLKIVESYGVKLLIGFQRRFDSNFKTIREQIVNGKIGNIRTFHITSRDPSPPPLQYLKNSGGIFLDMSSHDWDMARFITGQDIESVYVTANAFEDVTKEAGDIDTVISVLKMSDGTFGTIDNSRRCSYGYDQRIEVFGSKGSITGGNKSPDTIIMSGDQGITTGLPYSFFMDRYVDAYAGAMCAFVDMIQNGSAPPCTGSDGRASIVAAKAAAKSHTEGRLVRLKECELVEVK